MNKLYIMKVWNHGAFWLVPVDENYEGEIRVALVPEFSMMTVDFENGQLYEISYNKKFKRFYLTLENVTFLLKVSLIHDKTIRLRN